jgi:hypothetical protein
MALTAGQRREAMRDLARRLDLDGPLALTKDDLVAAVGGIDDYLEANAAAINAAIPQPARGALSVSQKAALVSFVALTRYGG